MVEVKNRIKIVACLVLGLCITNYMGPIHRRTSIEAANDTINGIDEKIMGKCYIIKNSFCGVWQWGNAVYFYLFSVMYLLRNGASVVAIDKIASNLAKPLGTTLDGAIYGPRAQALTDLNREECYEWDPKLVYREQGAMQDLMDLRNSWDDISSDWPKNKDLNINVNPFLVDFGVTPSLHEASQAIGVDWNEVMVVHIRQGDVMKIAYPPRNLFGHSQPPCAYYEDAIETGYDGAAFPFVLIITNSKEDEQEKNPCDAYLKDRYNTGRYPTKLLDYDLLLNKLVADDSNPHNFLRMDLHILTTAINLAEGHSTFTMGTTMFSTQLKRHFVPANPSTINCVWPFTTTLNGDYTYRRQYYHKDLTQIQYLLLDYFKYDASCDRINLRQLVPWFTYVSQTASTWDISKVNITTMMLEYPRHKLLKFKTTDQPFICESSNNPLMREDPSKWFAPCLCKETLIDHILQS